MPVIKTAFPTHSVLHAPGARFDYFDCYQIRLTDKTGAIKPINVAKAFFSSAPKWVDHLFMLRNKVVVTIGLKTPGKLTNRKEMLDNFHCEPGQRFGLFSVFSKTHHEVVLGEDDKHLNFRVSLLLGQHTSDGTRSLTVTTTVRFNNWFGRLYFLPVQLFHIMIVPAMMKGIVKTLERDNGQH
jgi:hypothetical protein